MEHANTSSVGGHRRIVDDAGEDGNQPWVGEDTREFSAVAVPGEGVGTVVVVVATAGT